MFNTHTNQWKNDIERVSSKNSLGRNKLRTYRLIKTDYNVEHYCKMLMSFTHRSALAKFRCGVAPIRLETGRYEAATLGDIWL